MEHQGDEHSRLDREVRASPQHLRPGVAVPRPSHWILCLAIHLVGCGGTEQPAQSQDPDQEVTLPAPQDTFLVAEVPTVSIGSDEDPLFRVHGGHFLSDGGIVIANAGSGQILYYDSAGARVMTVGRFGEGPGEFSQNLRLIERLRGDSVAAWDPPRGRVTVFAPDGSVVRITRMQAPNYSVVVRGRREPARPPAYVWFSTTGAPVSETRVLTRHYSGPDGIVRDTIPLFVHDVQGEAVHRLGPVPGYEHVVYQGTSTGRLFGHRFHVAVGDEAIYVGTGKPAVVHVYGLSGGRRTRLRLPIAARPVTTEAVDDAVGRYLLRFREQDRAGVRDLVHSVELPDSLPSYSALLVDGLERLWIQQYVGVGESPRRWLVYDPNTGAVVAVTLPPVMELLDANETSVLLMARDETDAEHVEGRRLIRR